MGMVFMCPKCWTLSETRDDVHQCTDACDCVIHGQHGECTIELDEKIAPAISILNMNGYTTTFCCEGHSNGSTPYICFDKDLGLEVIIEELCTNFNIWKFDSDSYKNSGVLRIHVPHNIDYVDLFDHKEFESAFEYFKKLYILDLAEGLEHIDPIEYSNHSARPLVSNVTVTKDTITIVGRICLLNESRKKYNSLKIGDSVMVSPQGIDFKLTQIDIIDSLYIEITAEGQTEDSNKSMDNIISKLYNKEMLFKSLGDF